MKLLNRIARLILDNLNLKVFLPLLAVALATTWWGLFAATARFAELSGGLRFVDMQPGLTPASLLEQIAGYSEAAVSYYLVWLVFDYAWPLITFTTMLFITAWLLGFVAEKWTKWFGLFIASAYMTVLMDWGENTGFWILIAARPDGSLWMAQLTVGLGTAKLFFNMVFNASFWILLIAVVVVQIRTRFFKR